MSAFSGLTQLFLEKPVEHPLPCTCGAHLRELQTSYILLELGCGHLLFGTESSGAEILLTMLLRRKRRASPSGAKSPKTT